MLNTESTAVISGSRCKTNKPEGIIYVRYMHLLPLYTSVQIKETSHNYDYLYTVVIHHCYVNQAWISTVGP